MHKLIIIIISAFLLGGCNRQDAHQPLSGKRLSFSEHDKISQSFTSSHSGLNIVSICLRNPTRILTPIEFTLHEASSSTAAIRQINFTGGNVDNQDCTKFQFEPVPDSQDKLYIAQLSIEPPSSPKLPRANIHVEAYPGEGYLNGLAFTDDAETELDLHFKTNYYQSARDVIKESSSQFAERLFQDKLFFAFYIAIVATTIYHLLKKK